MKNLLITLLAMVAILGASPEISAAGGAGKLTGKYERVTPPQPTRDPSKVEVLELFWYGCPHCYRLEPYLHRWLKKKPDYVNFVRVPAIFRKEWIPHAKAFYAAEALGVLDKINTPLFDAIHLGKRKFSTKEQLADFFAEQGVDRDAFLKTFDSFAVNAKTRNAKALTGRYGIRGVPALIVNGKYRVSGRRAGGPAGMIRVVNGLTKKEWEQGR